MSCGLAPKVSIIVPIYNVERYLSLCLDSCIKQTLYDIEIICVNDGSTDNSLAIAEEFAKIDNRIRIISKPNGGLSSARNTGLDNATGKLIIFLDSDDYIARNACERIWCESLEAPTDIIVFGTEIIPTTPRASQWHYDVLHVRTHRYFGFEPKVLFNEPSAKPFVWRQAYSKEFIDKHNLRFDNNTKYGEDMVFQLEAFPHGTNFSFIADKLYVYRWCRKGSLMASFRYDIDERMDRHFEIIETISDYWKEQNWFDLYGKDYLEWVLTFIVSDMMDPDAKRTDEHKAKLIAFIKKYGLVKYMDKMPWEYRSFLPNLNSKETN